MCVRRRVAKALGADTTLQVRSTLTNWSGFYQDPRNKTTFGRPVSSNQAPDTVCS